MSTQTMAITIIALTALVMAYGWIRWGAPKDGGSGKDD